MLNTRYITQKHQVNVRLAPLLGLVALASICTAPAYADTRIWLTWPGIIGPSNVVGHVGDIPLTSYSQNASNGGAPASVAVPGAVCGQVTITKLVDKTSPIFLAHVLKANADPQMTITFEVQNGTTTFPYYTVQLQNILPTSITQSDSTTDIITEQIVIKALRFRYTFSGQNPDGSLSEPVQFAFNCATQTGG
jgi:type VI protein secretion system component Hcp